MGEFDVIERLRAMLASAGADSGPRVALAGGDDAALIEAEGTSALSVDAVVEGVHFRRETASFASIGRKALAAAVSDLAAMGAGGGEALVSLGAPDDLGEDACAELIEGMIAGSRDWSVALVGGDVVSSPVLFVSVTVLGPVEVAVRRSGAEPGQRVVVTGDLGGAGAGLLLLERPELAAAIEPATADALRARQLEPEPRLRAGAALARAGATAMIDVSDGIAGDVRHLAEASGVAIEIDAERLPLAEGLGDVAHAAGVDPLDLALSAGEDYELVACLDEDALDAAIAAVEEIGLRSTAVGRVEAGAGEVRIRDRDGALREARGFEHG